MKLWRSSPLSIDDNNACQSSELFSTARGYLKCAVVHYHRIMYFCSMLLSSFFLDSGQFVLTSFQNQTLLLFVLGFVINRRIVIKVIKYMGHHNACVIRRLLGYNNICAITNNHFFKCLWVQKHFLLFPKFINIARNSKVLPLLLIIHFAQVFHLRSQKFLTFASGYN